MAQPKTLNGKQLLVKIGDGGSPTETFASDCLINLDRAFELTADGNDVSVPDCDNPSAPAWREKIIQTLSANVSGGGRLHTSVVEAYFTWLTTGASKNVRLELGGVSAANGGGYFSGAYKLTRFALSGSDGDLATAEVTLESTGAITWTDAAS
jgi:predicted secreted protein